MSIVMHSIDNQNEVARRLIQSGEGPNQSKAKNLHDKTITLGFGYTFIRNVGKRWVVLDTLNSDLASIGITLTDKQRTDLQNIARAQNDGELNRADTLATQFEAAWTAPPISDEQAETLIGTELARAEDAIQRQFRTILGDSDGDVLFASLDNTREKAGLLSLAYNVQSLIGAGLVRALSTGDRAEAWFQIRYDSNSKTQKPEIRPGIAKLDGTSYTAPVVARIPPCSIDASTRSQWRYGTRRRAKRIRFSSISGNGHSRKPQALLKHQRTGG